MQVLAGDARSLCVGIFCVFGQLGLTFEHELVIVLDVAGRWWDDYSRALLAHSVDTCRRGVR